MQNQEYGKRAVAFLNAFETELNLPFEDNFEKFLEWYEQRCKKLKNNSVRVYRNALISYLQNQGYDDTMLLKIKSIKGSTQKTLSAVQNKREKLIRPETLWEILACVRQTNSKYADFIKYFIVGNLYFGLSPSEWKRIAEHKKHFIKNFPTDKQKILKSNKQAKKYALAIIKEINKFESWDTGYTSARLLLGKIQKKMQTLHKIYFESYKYYYQQIAEQEEKQTVILKKIETQYGEILKRYLPE